MYGIIGEDRSDVDTLSVIVKRLAGNDRLPIKKKGYSGSGELLRKGAKQLNAFAAIGCTRLIVCYDADGPEHLPRFNQLMRVVVAPSEVPERCCAVIPVYELEAWILADIAAVTKIFTSWLPQPISGIPETIPDPKEHLIRLSKQANGKPRYVNAIHNERVALHLNLDTVYSRCPSFQRLATFVKQGPPQPAP